MPDEKDNAREINLYGCTYTVRAIFENKTTLEEILAKRALRDLEAENPEKSAPAACKHGGLILPPLTR
jgi:hypothetical protein